MAECYFCGQLATSNDHVPPKAFFPELKDLAPGSPDLRVNLITVPSCDLHNNALSQQDEIAAIAVTLHEHSNAAAIQQFGTKAQRALAGNRRLGERVAPDMGFARHPDGTLRRFVRVDAPLLHQTMERVARGLHLKDFGARWISDLRVISDGMVMPDLSAPPNSEAVANLRALMDPLPKLGENPIAFWYQWTPLATRVLRMVFYGGLGFFVFEREGGDGAIM